jgi:hypothetical protein
LISKFEITHVARYDLGTILLIILIIALLGGFSGLGGGPFYGTGYYGGGLGLVLIIVEGSSRGGRAPEVKDWSVFDS